jgi:hypothetical protein
MIAQPVYPLVMRGSLELQILELERSPEDHKNWYHIANISIDSSKQEALDRKKVEISTNLKSGSIILAVNKCRLSA